ncbi:2OG-Fe(II)-dependent halogenase WelO5 family protein [Streptomyces sp. 8N706]|uniref:2OG-Fe(II)-dependent halogenase WelO5 family protein n=1 Tax=Streptomyces sp. 8N706 TaxID=3457416 RepID=UPI003FD18C7C
MSAVSALQDQNVASTATPVYTLFDAIQTNTLDRDILARIGAGTLGAARVRDFFTRAQCEEIMQSLETCDMGSYDEQLVQPRIAKLGPATYDFYGNPELPPAYWEHTEQSDKSRSGLLFGTDPLDEATAKLEKVWGRPVTRATSQGRPMFAGMIREINSSAKMHFDEVVREFPGVVDETPLFQIAFNCHLAMPETGGEALVYRRKWQPSDERHRDGYGYAESIVADEPYVSVQAGVGDAVFFDPRNYHLVRPNVSGGRRVTLSFFMGVTADGSLITWS